MVTDSHTENYKPTEVGFFAVVSVEPIYVCLADYKMLPLCQTDIWGDFGNIKNFERFGQVLSESENRIMRDIGDVRIFDDGRRVYVEITCTRDTALLQQITNSARDIESSQYEEVQAGIFKIHINGTIELARAKALKLVTESSELFK